MNPPFLVPVLALLAATPVFGETIFKVDFSSGSPGGDVITAENALPEPYPGKDPTFFVKAKDVVFKLAADGALPGQYALLTDTGGTNSGFLFRWAEDAEDKVISSGVLTATWTMNFVSGSASDVSFQFLRPDLPKEAGRIARININSEGSVKLGGSTATGAAGDTRISKGLSLGTPHTFVWSLDYATGIQTLKVDGGTLLDYSSASGKDLNFFAAPAMAFKVEVRGDNAVVAFDDFTISRN